MIRRILPLVFITAMLSACAQPEPVLVSVAAPPSAPDHLYTPARIVPGRLEYAPDRVPFPPLLTERSAYPTQAQANAAYLRLVAGAPVERPLPRVIILFGCKPGTLDAQTARVQRYRGPVVHCAVDLLDGEGRRLERVTANFYHHRKLWHMQPVDPLRAPVAWRSREKSPRDPWWWLPGRPRYE